jgi:hypothetical protein
MIQVDPFLMEKKKKRERERDFEFFFGLVLFFDVSSRG